MKSLKTLSALAFALLAVLALASAVQAKPLYCDIQCTTSTACSTYCTDRFGEVGSPGQVITCSDWGVCDRGGCTCQTYIYGSSNPDTLSGDSSNNCIYGLDGNDTIYGSSGGDKLYGDGGDDTLYGQSGDDCLYGGSGSDHLDGGTGTDYCTQGETYVNCP